MKQVRDLVKVFPKSTVYKKLQELNIPVENNQIIDDTYRLLVDELCRVRFEKKDSEEKTMMILEHIVNNNFVFKDGRYYKFYNNEYREVNLQNEIAHISSEKGVMFNTKDVKEALNTFRLKSINKDEEQFKKEYLTVDPIIFDNDLAFLDSGEFITVTDRASLFTTNYIHRKILQLPIQRVQDDWEHHSNAIIKFFYVVFNGNFEKFKSFFSALAQPFIPKGSHFINLWGEGKNGKTTIMQLISETFKNSHSTNVSNIKIKDFRDPVMLQNLHNKIYNLSDEATYSQMKESTDTIKEMTTDWAAKPVPRKYQADPVITRFRGVLIMGSNQVLQTPDKTPAFFDRLLQFNLKMKFGRGIHNEIQKKEMFTSDMLDYFASLIISFGVEVYKECGGVYITAETKKIIDDLERRDNPLKSYISKHPISKGDKVINIFENFKLDKEFSWGDKENIFTFKRTLQELGYVLGDGENGDVIDNISYYESPIHDIDQYLGINKTENGKEEKMSDYRPEYLSPEQQQHRDSLSDEDKVIYDEVKTRAAKEIGESIDGAVTENKPDQDFNPFV